MKHSIIFTTIITLALSSQLVSAGPITDTYATGDPLTATTMENIKTEVNDNDARVGAIETQTSNLITGCPTSQSIRSIAADGAIACEVDSIGSGDITSVNTAAGSGLAGGNTVGSVNLRLANGYVSVSPAAFMPTNMNICKTITSASSHFISFLSTSASCKSNASVNLPHNADISSIRCVLKDYIAIEDISVNFRRVEHSTGKVTNMATLATTGAYTTALLTRTASIKQETVNNSLYNYSIEFVPGDTTTVSSNHSIYGCYITYSY